MKKSFVALLICLFIIRIFGGSDIFDFVHKDYDFVIRISKAGTWYDELKKVPFFSFVLGRKGLGFEDSFTRLLEDMKYRTGIDPVVIQDALSNDILFASKGLEVDLLSFVSFDVNYYLELVKNIANNSFIVFETKYPTQLPKALGYLLSSNVKQISQYTYILGDSLYMSNIGKYSILAGSKQSLDLALKTRETADMQLSRLYKDFERLKAGTFFVSGFSKPNTLRINLPVGIKIDDTDSENLVFTSNVAAGTFNFTVEQRNKKQSNSVKMSDNIGNLPLSWNYYISISPKNTAFLANLAEMWFSGLTSDVVKMFDLLKYLSTNSSNTYIVGRLEAGDILFIFDNFAGKDLEANILKLGGRYEAQKLEWEIMIQNSKFYAYKIGNRVFFGLINKVKFEQYDKTSKRFKDLPVYFDFSKISNYDLKLFMDINDIIKSTTGFNVGSKLLFWQYSTGYLTYYKFLIS